MGRERKEGIQEREMDGREGMNSYAIQYYPESYPNLPFQRVGTYFVYPSFSMSYFRLPKPDSTAFLLEKCKSFIKDYLKPLSQEPPRPSSSSSSLEYKSKSSSAIPSPSPPHLI
jgi:hypothetical protein